MQCTMEQLQQALIDERINLEQFIEVLVDNFGRKKTRKILEYNIKLAMKNQEDEDKNG